jgi:hypothetical protein
MVSARHGPLRAVPTCMSQALAVEGVRSHRGERSGMTDRTRPAALIVAQALIEEAHDARVAAHVRLILFRLKSRARKPSYEAA